MDKSNKWIRRSLAALLALTVSALGAGCSLLDPVVNVGSPTPAVTQNIAPQQTATPDLSTPVPTATPSVSSAPDTEQETEAGGSGAYTITADTNESGKVYYTEQADENALRVENGAQVNIDNARVEKRAGESSSLDNTAGYGLNAALLVKAGAELTMTDYELTADAAGATGVFVYAAALQMINGNIRTTGDDSVGAGVAAEGAITLREVGLATQGEYSPVIRAAAAGAVTMDGGMAVSDGAFSPVLAALGSIEVSNATLRANGAEAVAIDGGSVRLTDCAVTGRMGDVFSADALVLPYAVVLHRDAKAGGNESSFIMTRGALTALTGDLFYVTNTGASIYLEGVALSLGKERALLRVSGNDGSLGWGEAGKNGADCTLTAQDQKLKGDIIVDALSSVDVTLRGTSSFTGTINAANTARGAKVTLEDDATWTLTDNAYLTAFTGRVSSIDTNGFTVFVNGEPLTD